MSQSAKQAAKEAYAKEVFAAYKDFGFDIFVDADGDVHFSDRPAETESPHPKAKAMPAMRRDDSFDSQVDPDALWEEEALAAMGLERA